MPLEREQNSLISAIIPTYNAARFLPEALASIRRQAYEPLEIIVVDDGSTDETKSLMADWPDVRYLHQQNQGAAAARNTGIQAARGDLLAFLDADDLWTPDHLRILLLHLHSEPVLQFVWGTTHYVRMSEEAGKIRVSPPVRESASLFGIGSAVFRRSAFDEVGLFNVELRIGEDTDWLARARFARVAQRHIPETVMIYRTRKGSLMEGAGTTTVTDVLMRSIRRHRTNQRAA
jgi:glycosyltransferase involved in cell wall biosynthesis